MLQTELPERSTLPSSLREITRTHSSQDEINLIDILQGAWQRKIWVVSTIVLFSLIGWSAAMIRPVQYEALAVMNVGTVIVPQNGALSRMGLIEGTPSIERLLTSNWVLLGLRDALGLKSDYQSLKKLITIAGNQRELELFPELFINITFKDSNPEIAKRAVQFLGQQLIDEHEKYYDGTIEALDYQINLKSEKSHQAQLYLERLQKEFRKNKRDQLLNEMAGVKGALHLLQMEMIREQKFKKAIRKTDFKLPIDVKPEASKKLFFCQMGAFVGLVFSLMGIAIQKNSQRFF